MVINNKKKDHVYILGDFILTNKEKNRKNT